MAENRPEKEEIFEVPFHWTADYLYSYGEISRFFIEVVNNKKLYGARCTKCDMVWMPPKGYCSECYEATEWTPLSGKGTVIACTYCYQAPGAEVPRYLGLPYVLALIKLDGTDTYFRHGIATNEPTIGSVKVGSRVKVAFREERKGTIADFYFVLDE